MPEFFANQNESFKITKLDQGYNGSRSTIMEASVNANGVPTLALAANLKATSGGLPLGGSLVTAFTGRNGAGAITLASLKVGDRVTGVVNLSTPGAVTAGTFEATVTVAGQLQQISASNLSAVVYLISVVR